MFNSLTANLIIIHTLVLLSLAFSFIEGAGVF